MTATKEMEENKMQIGKNLYRIIKRMIDIIGALLGLAFLVPLTFVVWIANVIAGDNRCVFYKHTRIGKNGKEFKRNYYNVGDILLDNNATFFCICSVYSRI